MSFTYIGFDAIKKLSISPTLCVDWVREVFLHKTEDMLPPKISLHLPEEVFFNTMPCFIQRLNRFGVKVVSRFPQAKPALKSDILLYDGSSGNLLAVMDATWITAMRTGAVAALSALTFQHSSTANYGFIGLGNTARATFLCLYSQKKNCEKMRVSLLRYKDQAESFIQRFANLNDVEFCVLDDVCELIKHSDVVFSCVTAKEGLFAPDDCYPEGILLVPVHTRGFQNCDLFFDRIFGDDTGHVCGFKYFKQYKYFAEFSDVLSKRSQGRDSDKERIIAYNIGIALHDIYFASKIYDMLGTQSENSVLDGEKFWV